MQSWTPLRCSCECSKVVLLAVDVLYWIGMGGGVVRPFCSVSNPPKFDNKHLKKLFFPIFWTKFLVLRGVFGFLFSYFLPFSMFDALHMQYEVYMTVYVGRIANQRKAQKWLPFKKLYVRITKYLKYMY